MATSSRATGCSVGTDVCSCSTSRRRGKEWAGRPDLRDGFLAGYGRQLDETEVAGFRANSASGHLIQIIWATQHRDLAFAEEGRTYLAKMRLEP